MKRKRSKVVRATLGLVMLTTAISAIQRRKEVASAKPHRVGLVDDVLVLGSGGVLGIGWHVATLTRLTREGSWSIERDRLRIGTSAGSIVAMLLGSGLTLPELLELARGNNIIFNGVEIKIPELHTQGVGLNGRSDAWYVIRAISRLHVPYLGVLLTSLVPSGDVHLGALISFINSVMGSKWPATPTWVTATELGSGKRHVFSPASADTPGFAVAASCAVPTLYEPLSSNKGVFVDGGIISNLHLDVAIEFGVKRITVLVPVCGFVAPRIGDSVEVLFRKFSRNIQEIALIKGRIKAKLNGIELVVIRPRPGEQRIINTGRLMDLALLPGLIEATLKE